MYSKDERQNNKQDKLMSYKFPYWQQSLQNATTLTTRSDFVKIKFRHYGK